MAFGRHLAQERELRGLSRDDVVRATRLPASAIEAIESGDPERTPHAGLRRRLPPGLRGGGRARPGRGRPALRGGGRAPQRTRSPALRRRRGGHRRGARGGVDRRCRRLADAPLALIGAGDGIQGQGGGDRPARRGLRRVGPDRDAPDARAWEGRRLRPRRARVAPPLPGLLEPFTLLAAELTERRGDLLGLESASALRAHGAIRAELSRIAVAGYATELARELVRDAEPHPELFDLLAAFLGVLDAASPRPAALRAYELGALAAAGFMPRLDGCARCGAADRGSRRAARPVARRAPLRVLRAAGRRRAPGPLARDGGGAPAAAGRRPRRSSCRAARATRGARGAGGAHPVRGSPAGKAVGEQEVPR